MATGLIYLVGLATIIYHAWAVLRLVSIYIYRPSVPLARYKRGANSWALITGGTDGIGFGFAQTLRSQGWNVILLANEAKDAKGRLERESPGAGGEVKLLHYDAMLGTGAGLEELIGNVKDLPITLLVNNVGGLPIVPPHLRPLVEYPLQGIDDTIALNNRFMARVTCLMLPVLTKNGPSLIANMSSGAQIGIPWLTMYSATKGFVKAFSHALARELKAEQLPVDVVSMNPGDVSSFQHPAPLAWNVPSSRRFAEEAVRTLGTAVRWGCLEWNPFWVHGIMVALLDGMPEWVRQAALKDEMQKKHRAYDVECSKQ